MLSRKPSYQKTLLLFSLLLTVVILASVHRQSRAASGSSFLVSGFTVEYHADTDNDAGEEEFAAAHPRHKSQHLRLRYKVGKSPGRGTIEPAVIPTMDVAVPLHSYQTSLASSQLRPGYYLFLFRYTPF
jgi:hypothetical protein